jgi:hypothetical protein
MSMVTKATYNLVTFKDLMKTVTLTSYGVHKQMHKANFQKVYHA